MARRQPCPGCCQPPGWARGSASVHRRPAAHHAGRPAGAVPLQASSPPTVTSCTARSVRSPPGVCTWASAAIISAAPPSGNQSAPAVASAVRPATVMAPGVNSVLRSLTASAAAPVAGPARSMRLPARASVRVANGDGALARMASTSPFARPMSTGPTLRRPAAGRHRQRPASRQWRRPASTGSPRRRCCRAAGAPVAAHGVSPQVARADRHVAQHNAGGKAHVAGAVDRQAVQRRGGAHGAQHAQWAGVTVPHWLAGRPGCRFCRPPRRAAGWRHRPCPRPARR